MWKVENVLYELGDLAQEIFQQHAEGAVLFLPTADIVKWESNELNRGKDVKVKGAESW